MDASSEPKARWLGWLVLLAGLLGLVRLVPELYKGRHLVESPHYWRIVTADIAVALLTTAAGTGIILGRPWAARLGVAAGAAALIDGAFVFALMAPILLRQLHVGLYSQLMFYAPRLLHYAVLLLFWPGALGLLLRDAAGAGERRWLWLGASSLLSSVAMGVIWICRPF